MEWGGKVGDPMDRKEMVLVVDLGKGKRCVVHKEQHKVRQRDNMWCHLQKNQENKVDQLRSHKNLSSHYGKSLKMDQMEERA